MLTFKTDALLVGCGIDAEDTDRFSRSMRKGGQPSPIIFSPREIDHCTSLAAPSVGLCASFCCKEAVCKAVQQPYNGPECEFFWRPGERHYPITLSQDFRSIFQVTSGRAWVKVVPSGECVVQVYLFGDRGSDVHRDRLQCYQPLAKDVFV